jgi:hypothetical protein
MQRSSPEPASYTRGHSYPARIRQSHFATQQARLLNPEQRRSYGDDGQRRGKQLMLNHPPPEEPGAWKCRRAAWRLSVAASHTSRILRLRPICPLLVCGYMVVDQGRRRARKSESQNATPAKPNKYGGQPCRDQSQNATLEARHSPDHLRDLERDPRVSCRAYCKTLKGGRAETLSRCQGRLLTRGSNGGAGTGRRGVVVGGWWLVAGGW